MLRAVVSHSPLSFLRSRAAALTDRAHVPFSDAPVAAVLLLTDGAWIPGVRVESASYSLTLPALLNGYTTAVALNCADAVTAIALSRPSRREESLYVDALPHGPYDQRTDTTWIRADIDEDALPSPTDPLPPVLSRTASTATEGLRACRALADRAYVPSSEFPVTALAETDGDRLVPGVNVEHPDWARILCAERNALGTVQSYALGPVQRLFLSCLHDPQGTPCGACRQLLAELAPASKLWLDRHDEPPARTSPSELLPGSFRGGALLSESA